MKYWFTSDYHIGHHNCLALCNRPFKDITEHDNTLIANHNSLVTDNDVVIDLGDVGFRCRPEYLADCLSDMNGKRIIILGNHDKPLRQAYKKGLLDKLIKSNKLEIVGGETIINDKTLAINKMFTINNQDIFCGHYCVKSWPGAYRNSWHLYGHSHNNLPGIFKSMDVGVDTHNYFPWSFDEIKAKFDLVKEDFSENRTK